MDSEGRKVAGGAEGRFAMVREPAARAAGAAATWAATSGVGALCQLALGKQAQVARVGTCLAAEERAPALWEGLPAASGPRAPGPR